MCFEVEQSVLPRWQGVSPILYLSGRTEAAGTRLGRGTFGTVVEAVNRGTGLPVAIKIIPLGEHADSPEDEKRRHAVVKREMNLMGSINHVSISR